MNRTRIGWTFVGIQVVLLLALVFLPTGDNWSLPGWLSALSYLLILTGIGVAVGASVSLGKGLTPTPIPNGKVALRTDGLFAYVRHPIYSGVLLIVLGLTLRSRSMAGLAVGFLTVAFFIVKTEWEEKQLRETFPDYAAYAESTPRFVPKVPWRRLPVRGSGRHR